MQFRAIRKTQPSQATHATNKQKTTAHGNYYHTRSLGAQLLGGGPFGPLLTILDHFRPF